jgi:hypothetical protein
MALGVVEVVKGAQRPLPEQQRRLVVADLEEQVPDQVLTKPGPRGDGLVQDAG